MTSLHVICGLGPPPNQKSWLRLWRRPITEIEYIMSDRGVQGFLHSRSAYFGGRCYIDLYGR